MCHNCLPQLLKRYRITVRTINQSAYCSKVREKPALSFRESREKSIVLESRVKGFPGYKACKHLSHSRNTEYYLNVIGEFSSAKTFTFYREANVLSAKQVQRNSR